MGGLGSGTWDRDDFDRKTAVAECYAINVNRLARDGKLHVGAAGAYSWNNQYGEHLFSVQFSAVHDDHCRLMLLLSYRWKDWRGEDSEDVSLPIRLQTTHPHLGGWRWWFTCPLIIGGNRCNRRVGKLYLPDDARYFGCRHCHELVYRREPDPFEHADRMLKVLRKRHERLMAKHGWQT